MMDRIIPHDVCTLGLDVGDNHSQYCALAADGTVVQEGRIRTTVDGLREYFSLLKACRVALEAGIHSPWISRLLQELGHEVIIANPRKVRLIYQNHDKCDRVDARYLARIARMDPSLLSPLRHRTAAIQADLAVLRARNTLIKARTQLVNHMRGAVKSYGGRLPKCSSSAFVKKAGPQIPEALKPALEPLLRTVQDLTDRIAEQDRTIEGLVSKYPEAENLKQVPGVGPLTSVTFMLTLEDPHRFKKSRTVGSYLGLRPRKRDSGDRESQLGISKAGDMFLRRLLVTCAHYILGPFGPDTDLRRWGLSLATRGGKNGKKRAVVAVARKLAVLLHRLWVSGRPYEPLRNSRRNKLQVISA